MKTTGNYATYKSPDRLESLKQSVESIIDQVDLVRIYWNGYTYWELPAWANNSKIHNSFGDDLTDNGKFHGLSFIEQDEFYLLIDDDLVYPDSYVAFTRAHLRYYPIVTFHGRILKTDGNYKESYYYGAHHCYSFNNDLEKGITVDIAGTGVTAIDTRRFCPKDIYSSKHKRMSDLVFSLEATKQKIPIFVAPHKGNWIKQIRMTNSICIGQQKKDQSEQVGIVLEIMELKELI